MKILAGVPILKIDSKTIQSVTNFKYDGEFLRIGIAEFIYLEKLRECCIFANFEMFECGDITSLEDSSKIGNFIDKYRAKFLEIEICTDMDSVSNLIYVFEVLKRNKSH